jgi:hypothetical protein
MLERLKEFKKEFEIQCLGKDVESKVSFWIQVKISLGEIKTDFDFFQKYHDMHYQFEEYWKFAGVTNFGKLNPILYGKM